MSDGEDATARYLKKGYRRKRRHQGASWTPPSASALKEDGVWCPIHRQRHGYMSKGLGVYFDKGSHGEFQMIWYCKQTGDVLDVRTL